MAWPVSDRFTAALLRSHTSIARVDVLSAGQVIATDIGAAVTGKVSISATAAVRRQCDIVIADADGILTPATAGDLLAPYGNEFALYRGILFDDGTSEMVPLGVFRISKPVTTRSQTVGRSIEITGFDRARTVARAKLTDYVAIAAGQEYADAIRDLIAPALDPAQLFSFAVTGHATPTITLKPGDDRWAQATAMAGSVGCVLGFDQVGTCILQPVPDPSSTAPVLTLAEGDTSGLIDLQPTLDDVDTYNHVVVEGSGTGLAAPVRGEAVDSDPSSPTFIGPGWGTGGWTPGPYGDVVDFTSTNLVTTLAQAHDMAAGRLLQGAGLTQLVPFTALVQPHVDAYDVIAITSGPARVDALYVLDTAVVPLEPAAAMTGTTRARRT